MLSIGLMIMLAGVPPAHPAHPEDMAGLFRPDDYPLAAVVANEQGVTTVRAKVAPDGTPTGCRIVKSSRSTSLDEATCQIVMQRGRFIETAKLHGRKPFEIEAPVRWVMADRVPAPFDVDLDRATYSLDGRRIVGCRGEVASWRTPVSQPCDYFRKIAEEDLAAVDDKHIAGRRDYVLEAVSIPGDHRFDNGFGENPGEELLGRDSILLSIDASGKVIRCEEGERQVRSETQMRDWCKSQLNERFVALADGSDEELPRQLTRIGGAYFKLVTRPQH